MNKFIFYIFILHFICVSFAFGMKEENNLDDFNQYFGEVLQLVSELPKLDPLKIDEAIEKLTNLRQKVDVLEEKVLLSIFGKEYEKYKTKKSPVDYGKDNIHIYYQTLKPLKFESLRTNKEPKKLKQWIFSDFNYEKRIPTGRYLLRFLFISNLMKYLKLEFINFISKESNIEGENYIKLLINKTEKDNIDFAQEMNGWFEDFSWKSTSTKAEIFLKYIGNTNNNICISVNDAHRYIIVDTVGQQKNSTPIKNLWIEQKIWHFLNDLISKHFEISKIPQSRGTVKVFPGLQDKNLAEEEKESRLKCIESLSVVDKKVQKPKPQGKKKKKKTKKKRLIKTVNNQNQNNKLLDDIPNYFSSEETEKIKNLPQNQTGYTKFKFININPNQQKKKYTLNYVNKGETEEITKPEVINLNSKNKQNKPITILKRPVVTNSSIENNDNKSNELKEETTDYSKYLYGELDSINYQIFESMIDSLNDLRNIILFVANKPLISNKKMLDLIKKYIVALYDNKHLYNEGLVKTDLDKIINPKLNSFKKYTISNALVLSAIPEDVVFDIDIFESITSSSNYFNNGYYLYLDKLKEVSNFKPYDNSIQFDHRAFLGEVSESMEAKRYIHLVNFHYEIIDKYWQLQNIIAEYLLVSLGLMENPEPWIKKEALDKWQSFFNNLEDTAINLNLFLQKMLSIVESKDKTSGN